MGTPDLAVATIGGKGRGGVRIALVALVCGLAAACTSGHSGRPRVTDSRLGAAPSPHVVAVGQSAPRGGGRYHVGKPYSVAGRTYHPKEDPDYRAEGVASWYGSAFQGRRTANGEIFDMHALSAAHPTLPLPSYVRVTNLTNHRSVVVRVNDRGPFGHGRVIDVSKRTAEMLGFIRAGKTKVRVEYVGRARLDGQDGRLLVASFQVPGGVPQGEFGETRTAFAPQPPTPASDAAQLAAFAAMPTGMEAAVEPVDIEAAAEAPASGDLPAGPQAHILDAGSDRTGLQASYAAERRISAAFVGLEALAP